MVAFHQKGQKMYILSNRLALSCGSGGKIGLYFRGGISSERAQMYILSDKLTLFVNME